MKRHMKKAAAAFLCAVMVFGNIHVVSAADIDAVQQEVDQLENQKSAAASEQQALADQLNAIITDMQATQDKLEQKEAEIEQAENDLIAAKVEENAQYESMKKRIRYMYENGNSEFIEVLVTAKDISDLLNKAEYITKISEYDREMLNEFQAIVKQVEEQEAKLKADYEELNVLQQQLTAKQNEVQTLLEQKKIEVANLDAAIGEKNVQLQMLIEEAKRAEELRRQEEEARRQQEEQAKKNQNNNNNNSGGGSYTPSDGSSQGGGSSSETSGNGSFVHPCPAGHVSSGFGYRDFDHSFHKGVDFGTSGAYVPTYAAAAGKVIQAGWSNSAGNWVVISHGNGLVTKYMHHSSLLVSTGQSVSAGQQIGVTGNTGNSAGVHLHFQVELNGKAVNPFNYL